MFLTFWHGSDAAQHALSFIIHSSLLVDKFAIDFKPVIFRTIEL